MSQSRDKFTSNLKDMVEYRKILGNLVLTTGLKT